MSGVSMPKSKVEMQISEARGSSRRGAPGEGTPVDNRSTSGTGGRVVHDSRGNAVWDWAVATGVLASTKALDLLQMLDNPSLAIEGECELAHEWAGDPYNRG
jgi:hypothetical protein